MLLHSTDPDSTSATVALSLIGDDTFVGWLMGAILKRLLSPFAGSPRGQSILEKPKAAKKSQGPVKLGTRTMVQVVTMEDIADSNGCSLAKSYSR